MFKVGDWIYIKGMEDRVDLATVIEVTDSFIVVRFWTDGQVAMCSALSTIVKV